MIIKIGLLEAAQLKSTAEQLKHHVAGVKGVKIDVGLTGITIEVPAAVAQDLGGKLALALAAA